MKRRKLLQHAQRFGCYIHREGGRHTILRNSTTGAQAALPRHPEVKPTTALRICRQLGIPDPGEP